MKTILLLCGFAVTLSAAELDVPGRLGIAAGALGAKPEETAALRPAEAAIRYDADFLYVDFALADPDVRSSASGAPSLHGGDVAELFLDAAGDHRQILEIQINPAGEFRVINHLFTGASVKLDAQGLYTDWGNVWDCMEYAMKDLRVTAAATPSGWQCSIAIPAADLLRRTGKRKLEAGMTLRANFVRFDLRGDGESQMSFWSPTAYGRPHRSPGRMGVLHLK